VTDSRPASLRSLVKPLESAPLVEWSVALTAVCILSSHCESETSQEGAVVSRTLLKRAGGTLTPFAFDEGQSLSEHTAPFDAVAHVLEGEADITIAGTPLTVSSGEMVLMPANQPHAVHARPRFKMLLTMIRSV
jgi:quercetin dioxygenase-like cupin family protein